MRPLVEAQPVIGAGDHQIAGVEAESEIARLAFALAFQLHRHERCVLDRDVELLRRRDEHEAPVFLAPQDRREQPHHFRPADRAALVKPGPVAGDAHGAVAAMARVPQVDRRKLALLRQPGDIAEAEAGKIGRGGSHGHDRGLAGRLAMRKAER